MKLTAINKDTLNKFLAEQKHSQFLQSWEWGGFNSLAGHKIERLGIEDNNKLIAVFTLIKKNLGAGKSYWYSPRGPILQAGCDQQEIFDCIVANLGEKGKEENIVFFRFDSLYDLSKLIFQKNVVNTIDVQPSKTLILNISISEEDILGQMHQKTRYNIRLAQKKDVEIVELQNQESKFEEWWKILEQTRDRDGFRLHDKTYYQNMIALKGKSSAENSLLPSAEFKLLVASHQGKIIAGNIISLFGDTATYVHGASANQFRNTMAPYLLQWEAIKLAKKNGCEFYDFYGIDEHKWPGVSRFKKGFGGEEHNYFGTYDLVFDNLCYNAYKLIRKIRRLL